MPAAALAQDQPLTLDDCKALAIKNNAQVQESRLDARAAEETGKAARTKYFLQVSASAGGFLAWDPLAQLRIPGGNLPVYDGNPANLLAATQSAYSPGGAFTLGERASVAALTAVEPLYTGGRVRNGNRLAQLGVQVAHERTELSRRDVAVETEEKYWRLIALHQKLGTLRAYEDLLAALDRQVTDALDAGLVTSNDQLKVRLTQAEAGVDRQRLESGIHLSARDLRRHIGLPPGDAVSIVETLPPPEDPAPLSRPDAGALDRRIEMRLLASAVRAEELQASLKRAEGLPTVAGGAALFRLDVRGLPGMTNALVFGQVAGPISGIWETQHNLASQAQRVSIAKSKLASTRELLALDVAKSWSDLRVAWDAYLVCGKAIEQAEVNVREVSDRYTNGMVTFSNLLEAQVLRQQSQDRRIDAVEDRLKRSAYLRSIAED